MGASIVDSHANEWLELLMDWELAESRCSLQNEGSSTLTFEGGASHYECSNLDLGPYDSTSCKYTASDCSIILNHTANTHYITTSSNSLHLNDTLSEAREEDTSLASQEFDASPLDATSTKLAADTPNYHIDATSQVVKEAGYPSYFSSHNGVGGSYNTIIKGSDIKDEKFLPHDINMMGNFPLISAGRRQACMVMRQLASMKSKGSNTHVLSRRSKANDSVLEQACEISKATDNVQLGEKLNMKITDENLLQLISGMHQEGKEPSPWPSSNHLAKCSDVDTSYTNTRTASNSRPPDYGASDSSPPSTQLARAHSHQYYKSHTLSFNQHNKPTSKRPQNYHDHDDEFHNSSSLGLLFSHSNYSFIKESELDDMSGITGNDDEESFALITNAYKTRKKAKVEDDNSARHCLAERKRREKLNKKFDELRTIVGPSLSIKTDKASIIGAAVKLLNDKKNLQSLVDPEVAIAKIMTKVASKSKDISSFHSHLMPKGDKAKVSDGSSSSFQVDSHPHKKEPHANFSEVFCDLEADIELIAIGSSSCNSLLHDIKVNAKQQSPQRWHYIINVRCPKRPNIFSDIIITLSKLDLQVIFANSCFCDKNTSSVTSPSMTSSPTMTWFLLKVEVVEKFSRANPDQAKCEIIHDAIKGCIF